MKKSTLCLLLLLLLSNVYSQHEESDIEKLKGTWRVFTEDEDPFHGIKDNVLASPVLEIVDASTCQLTFFGTKALGDMIVNEEKNTIDLWWKDSDIKLTYSLVEDSETIKMLALKKDYVFKKTSDTSSIDPKNISGILADSQFIVGKWELKRKRGGGPGAAENFLFKEGGSIYRFSGEKSVSIAYSNDEIEQGSYAIKEGKGLLIQIGKDKRMYEFVILAKQEIRLKELSNGVVLTLERIDYPLYDSKPSPVPEDTEPVDSADIIAKYQARYQKVRTDILDHYEMYSKKMASRKQTVGNVKIMEDIDFVKASATLEEFIDQCPRIELGMEELYLESMEAYLSYLKKSK